jgi:ketosteroid isomerase-like protein
VNHSTNVSDSKNAHLDKVNPNALPRSLRILCILYKDGELRSDRGLRFRETNEFAKRGSVMKTSFRREISLLLSGLLLVAISLTLFASRAQAADNESDKQAKAAAIKADEDFNEALRNKDRGALDRLIADNVSWVARGDRLDKARIIADIMSENLHFKQLTHDGVVVKVFGNTAVMTGHSTSVLEYKGKMFTAPRLFTSVYMNLNGQWQLVAHQVTDLNDEKK